jgi:hypothetical protein
MIAIAVRMYFISFKLSNDAIVSILAGILVSLLLWGVGYIKDSKILLSVSVMEIFLTLIVFWFETKNINNLKQKELAIYNQQKQELIQKEYERLIEERNKEILLRTITIPKPFQKNCPTTWFVRECEDDNSLIQKRHEEKYAKEIQFNQDLQRMAFPDKSKIEVFLPEPSEDSFQRILISFLFNLSIPIFYYLLGLHLASSGFSSTLDEAINRYKNRTDETVMEICRDLGIPVSTLYSQIKKLETVEKPIEDSRKKIETDENSIEESGNELETDGINCKNHRNPLETNGNFWKSFGNSLEGFGKSWKLVGKIWKPVGNPLETFGNNQKPDKKAGQDGFS